MSTYKMVVFTNGVEGHEDEYNDWYDNVHLRDVRAVPGVVGAERFRLVVNIGTAEHVYKYCAIYEVDSDAPAGVVEELQRRAGTEQMVLTPYMDAVITAGLFEPLEPG